MDNDTTQRGGGEQHGSLPDYYLGFLIMFDEFSKDACKWVVYDGTSRVRCPNRTSAIEYITERYKQRSGHSFKSRIIDARISLNHAIEQLDAAANELGGVEQIHLQRLAVRLKPVLVDIDNITLNES